MLTCRLNSGLAERFLVQLSGYRAMGFISAANAGKKGHSISELRYSADQESLSKDIEITRTYQKWRGGGIPSPSKHMELEITDVTAKLADGSAMDTGGGGGGGNHRKMSTD